jgi:probable HAF family extracellular repeat protein
MIDIGYLPGGDAYTEARAISADGRTVVGHSSSSYAYQAFRWTAESGMQLIDLGTPGRPGEATGVSGDGKYVVGVTGSAGGCLTDGFLWSEEGGTLEFGPVPDFLCLPELDVADDGQTIVGNSLSFIHDHMAPFIWDSEHGSRLLETVLTEDYGLDLTGWDLVWVSGVSSDGGIIAGYGTNPDGNCEAWIAGIPEPGALGLATSAAGLAVLGFRCRWR